MSVVAEWRTVQQATNIETEMKSKLSAYEAVKTAVNNYERNQGCVCSLVIVFVGESEQMRMITRRMVVRDPLLTQFCRPLRICKEFCSAELMKHCDNLGCNDCCANTNLLTCVEHVACVCMCFIYHFLPLIVIHSFVH